MLEALGEHYGPLRRSRVIPNGRSYQDVDGVKEAFVFASGRIWDEAKNLRALVEASGDIPWPVVIAGEGRAGSGSPREVRWLGRLASDDMSAWMRRAAIYAAPALYEPFGLGILEAALAGCALVLGDIPSLREIWADAAAYVDLRQPQALAEALRRLAECPEERVALAARARSRAAAYSVDRMACGYLNAYAGAREPAPQLCL
jgi:glycosyltransferase involved in cell wall biosynthesis